MATLVSKHNNKAIPEGEAPPIYDFNEFRQRRFNWEYFESSDGRTLRRKLYDQPRSGFTPIGGNEFRLNGSMYIGGDGEL